MEAPRSSAQQVNQSLDLLCPQTGHERLHRLKGLDQSGVPSGLRLRRRGKVVFSGLARCGLRLPARLALGCGGLLMLRLSSLFFGLLRREHLLADLDPVDLLDIGDAVIG